MSHHPTPGYGPTGGLQHIAGQAPIIINNQMQQHMGGGYILAQRRKQSFWTHLWLFLFTMGIGNIIYAVHIEKWNRERGM